MLILRIMDNGLNVMTQAHPGLPMENLRQAVTLMLLRRYIECNC